MRIEGYHEGYGRVMMDADDLATNHPMIEVTLINKRDQFDHCDNVLTVGKSALKDSGGYTPKHRDKPLAELYLPLAMKTAARMRKGNDEYEELVGVATEALVKAANKNKHGHVVNFAVFVKKAVENAIIDHWRKQAARPSYVTGEWDWDDMIRVKHAGDTDFSVKLHNAVQGLRPRLRQLVQRLFLGKHPAMPKELAYEWNVSVVRITQLKQEAMESLRESLKIK